MSINSCNEQLLEEINHYGPVTALKFHGDHLLVGYGPVLKLFHTKKLGDPPIWQKRVFKRNKIHSIAICEETNTLAVSGGRSFAIFPMESDEIRERAINEWIIAVEFIEPGKVAILNSHNVVLVVDITILPFSVAETVHCGEKSILYSGSITKTTTGDVYVAAGTVMDGVIIWNLKTRNIVHLLKDHEGSIFAVKIDKDAQYIISCSDDRSIKAFTFSDGKLLASGWGHGSRIWSLLFGKSLTGNLQIVSMGEDCSTRIWNYTGESTLQCIKTFEHCHEGKHIWSGDSNYAMRPRLATGGADGKVRLLDADEEYNDPLIFEFDHIERYGMNKVEDNEHIKSFASIPMADETIVVSSAGRVFSIESSRSAWVDLEISIKDFVSLKSHERQTAVVVTKSGSVLMINQGDEVSTEWYHPPPEKSYKIINVLSRTTEIEMHLLLDSPVKGSPFVFMKLDVVSEKPRVVATVELPKPTDCSFTPTSFHFDSGSHYLFVGSRHANVAVYDLSQTPLVPPYLIRKICPGDTITSLSTVGRFENGNTPVVLLTVRDGTYLYFHIKCHEDVLSHEIILQNKFNKGSVEGGFVYEKSLLLYGFRSSLFYVWNETNQTELLNESCGGARRHWEFRHWFNDLMGGACMEFRFINKSGLVLKSRMPGFSLPRNGLLANGTHGREIRSCAVSDYTEIDGSKIIVTASEDATIKIGKIDCDGQMECVWTMNNHVSGLQSVKFADKDHFISSAANEEMIVWKLHRFDESQFSAVEIGRLPVSGVNPDLRIMDFSSIKNDQGFLVAAVFSNSVVKLFQFNTSTNSFLTIGETVYSQFCLLNIEFLSTASQTFVCVGATDGNFTIWDVTTCITSDLNELSAPIVKQQLHQSAIKAFAIHANEKTGTWDVLTGGDDNALTHSRLLISSSGALELSVISFVEKAASATITGVVHVGEQLVFVTSVDQIVRVWDYSSDLTCKSANYTTVADTGCCAYAEFEDSRLAIAAGAGLSFFSLQKDSKIE